MFGFFKREAEIRDQIRNAKQRIRSAARVKHLKSKIDSISSDAGAALVSRAKIRDALDSGIVSAGDIVRAFERGLRQEYDAHENAGSRGRRKPSPRKPASRKSIEGDVARLLGEGH